MAYLAMFAGTAAGLLYDPVTWAFMLAGFLAAFSRLRWLLLLCICMAGVAARLYLSIFNWAGVKPSFERLALVAIAILFLILVSYFFSMLLSRLQQEKT
jgi:hypothetical protein